MNEEIITIQLAIYILFFTFMQEFGPFLSRVNCNFIFIVGNQQQCLKAVFHCNRIVAKRSVFHCFVNTQVELMT